MANGRFRVFGVTVSMAWLSFIAMAFFIKSAGIFFDDWFTAHADIIMYISGAAIFFFILTGWITVRSLTKRGVSAATE